MFGAKYSRLKFWIVSIGLFILAVYIHGMSKIFMYGGELEIVRLLSFGVIVIALVWINTLANRIRDYGGNPYIALLALLPFVNLVLAFFYGIARHKKDKKAE